MKIVLRFKKKGMRRFLSTLESIKLVERSIRRADFSIVFTEGFHPKPKMSFLDAMPVGVVNLAFYVELFVKNISEKHIETLKNILPKDFALESAWIFDGNINELVNSYRFLVISEKPVDLEKTILKKNKKVSFKESLLDFEISSGKKYHIFRYTQKREKLINPLLLAEEGTFFLPICEEAMTGHGPLSSLLERGGTRV